MVHPSGEARLPPALQGVHQVRVKISPPPALVIRWLARVGHLARLEQRGVPDRSTWDQGVSGDLRRTFWSSSRSSGRECPAWLQCRKSPTPRAGQLYPFAEDRASGALNRVGFAPIR